MISRAWRDFPSSAGAFTVVRKVRSEPGLVLYNANILTTNTVLPRVKPRAITAGRFRVVATIVATQTGQT